MSKAKRGLSERAKKNCIISLVKEGIPLKDCQRIVAALNDIKTGRMKEWKSIKRKIVRHAAKKESRR